MLVGNDVVDLRDPENQPEALHARFDARVFTADEREALGVSASPHELRWTLWAAKESVYKIAKKLDPSVRFLWREYSTHSIGEGRVVVMHETRSFSVRVDRNDERVHAVATLNSSDAPRDRGSLSSGIERLEAEDADPSWTVREFVRSELGSRLELPPDQVQIAAERGIPVALWRNRRLPVDLSLSHHGRFVAWACGDCVIPVFNSTPRGPPAPATAPSSVLPVYAGPRVLQ